MARARRKQGVQAADGERTPIVKRMPGVCPVCEVDTDEMLAHLQSHAPEELCQRCDGKEKGWRLDTDGATHFRPDVSIFYCSHCGRHAQVNLREEVIPSGEA